ncbi:hypothetical protein Tco_0875313 [Tanacetum coccineum]|uniref:Uncharacterized protein n=1 Tax=Tanacetum coccineum TaxID=301880 RepID=A0ABQ5BRW5_9ASTR
MSSTMTKQDKITRITRPVNCQHPQEQSEYPAAVAVSRPTILSIPKVKPTRPSVSCSWELSNSVPYDDTHSTDIVFISGTVPTPDFYPMGDECDQGGGCAPSKAGRTQYNLPAEGRDSEIGVDGDGVVHWPEVHTTSASGGRDMESNAVR